jgi:hypothetical protein
MAIGVRSVLGKASVSTANGEVVVRNVEVVQSVSTAE